MNNARKADITLQRTRLLHIFHDSTVFTLDLAFLFYCVSVWIILCLMYNHHYTLSCLYHSCFCGRLAYLSTSTCLNLCSNMLFFSSLLFSFSFSCIWCVVFLTISLSASERCFRAQIKENTYRNNIVHEIFLLFFFFFFIYCCCSFICLPSIQYLVSKKSIQMK